MTGRAEYIEGLRLLADLLEHHDTVPLPYDGNRGAIAWVLNGKDYDKRAALQQILVAVPGAKSKDVIADGAGDDLFTVEGRLAGLRVKVILHREDVCERVVVGVETVTKTVPDPELVQAALADIPEIEVTEQVEHVEWRCSPLLASAGGDGAS